MVHYPVMKEKVIEYLNLKEGGIYIDATCGWGGHSRAILEKCKDIFLFCVDKDKEAIEMIKENLKEFSNFKVIYGGFENLKQIIGKEYIGKIDGILFDLGFSLNQVKDSKRGFSFQEEGPLDMRYDTTQKLTSWEIINQWGRKNLIWIFKNYGEIKRPEKIVDKILERRKRKKFETTREFADFISRNYREKPGIHPATKFFMALRITVNDELASLEKGLKEGEELLKKGGRFVIITFHSLEDRIVKRFFKNSPSLKVLTKKPVLPEKEEVELNKQSRSAKLRAAEKI